MFINYVRFCFSGPCPEGSFLHPGQEVQSRGMQRQDPLRRTLHQVQVSWSAASVRLLFHLPLNDQYDKLYCSLWAHIC